MVSLKLCLLSTTNMYPLIPIENVCTLTDENDWTTWASNSNLDTNEPGLSKYNMDHQNLTNGHKNKHHSDVKMSTIASRLLTQPFVQAQIKENIKALTEFTGDQWIPAQRASDSESVSIWWRHHELASHFCVCTVQWAREYGVAHLQSRKIPTNLNWCLPCGCWDTAPARCMTKWSMTILGGQRCHGVGHLWPRAFNAISTVKSVGSVRRHDAGL